MKNFISPPSCYREIHSPSNSWRNEAWVPVVPFTPRNFKSSLARRRALSSIRRSWSHKRARLPTVVSCAGWRWVNPKVGKSRYCRANSARRDSTLANFGRRMSNPWRSIIKSYENQRYFTYTNDVCSYCVKVAFVLPRCHRRSNSLHPDELSERRLDTGPRKR